MFDQSFLNQEVSAPVSTNIPEGNYTVQCERAELKTAKSGGKYINAMFNITSEQSRGRKVFNIFNVENNSEKAQEIGRRQLFQFLLNSGTAPQAVVGKTYEQTCALMLNQVVGVKLKHKKEVYNGEETIRENISYFEPATPEGKRMVASFESADSAPNAVSPAQNGASIPAPF